MSKKETQYNLEGLEEILTDQQPTQELEQAAQQVLTDNEMDEVAEEIRLEKEFGDKGLRTFVESAASAASFGLSDQALVKFGGEKMREALRERRERNKAAALAGEAAGIIAPSIGTGGTSLAAKGLSAGVKTAAKAGTAAERITAKQLAKIAQQTGKNKLATDVITKSISKTAGSAVEGAFYGAGELVKEDALGTSDFNAENLIASAGTGAAIGGTLGGIFGTAEAIVPIIKNNKIVDVVSKKINRLAL